MSIISLELGRMDSGTPSSIDVNSKNEGILKLIIYAVLVVGLKD